MDAVPITKKLIAFGSKKIYLPKFTIALIRTPTLSPYQARFLVPLSFSKYDLRDYLYHAYSLRTHNIRSFVKSAPVRDTQDQPRHFFRPEAKKYMTVEMESPFVWPETPADMRPWGNEEKKREIKDMTRMGGRDPESERGVKERLVEEARRVVRRGRRGWEEGRTERVVRELDGDEFLVKV